MGGGCEVMMATMLKKPKTTRATCCPHGRVPRRCTLCGGKDICEHRKIRTCCAACGGSQICPHGVRRYVCRECADGGGAYCEHSKVKHTCRLCNPRHALFGVTELVSARGDVRGSAVEHVLLEALLARLPPDAAPVEQFRVPSPRGTHFRVDMAIEFRALQRRCIVEVDGAQHYRDFDAFDVERQFARDRFVEQWGLAHGYSVFRVPETLARSAARRARAAEYVTAAMGAACGAPRVHYLDYGNTYAGVSAVACELGDVEFIRCAPCMDSAEAARLGVYHRSAANSAHSAAPAEGGTNAIRCATGCGMGAAAAETAKLTARGCTAAAATAGSTPRSRSSSSAARTSGSCSFSCAVVRVADDDDEASS